MNRDVLARALADTLYDHVHPHGLGQEQDAAKDVLKVLDRYLPNWDRPPSGANDPAINPFVV